MNISYMIYASFDQLLTSRVKHYWNYWLAILVQVYSIPSSPSSYENTSELPADAPSHRSIAKGRWTNNTMIILVHYSAYTIFIKFILPVAEKVMEHCWPPRSRLPSNEKVRFLSFTFFGRTVSPIHAAKFRDPYIHLQMLRMMKAKTPNNKHLYCIYMQ